MEQKRSILSIEAVPQTRLRYARGISLKQKRFKLSIGAIPQTCLRYEGV